MATNVQAGEWNGMGALCSGWWWRGGAGSAQMDSEGRESLLCWLLMGSPQRHFRGTLEYISHPFAYGVDVCTHGIAGARDGGGEGRRGAKRECPGDRVGCMERKEWPSGESNPGHCVSSSKGPLDRSLPQHVLRASRLYRSFLCQVRYPHCPH